MRDPFRVMYVCMLSIPWTYPWLNPSHLLDRSDLFLFMFLKFAVDYCFFVAHSWFCISYLFSFLALHISFPIFSLKPNWIPSFIHMPLMLCISLKLIQTCSSFFEGMRETNVVSTLPLNSVMPSLEQNMKKCWLLSHFKRCT